MRETRQLQIDGMSVSVTDDTRSPLCDRFVTAQRGPHVVGFFASPNMTDSQIVASCQRRLDGLRDGSGGGNG